VLLPPPRAPLGLAEGVEERRLDPGERGGVFGACVHRGGWRACGRRGFRGGGCGRWLAGEAGGSCRAACGRSDGQRSGGCRAGAVYIPVLIVSTEEAFGLHSVANGS
jgi:hypothetical protein